MRATGVNPFVVLWTALGAAAALATLVLLRSGRLRVRDLALPVAVVVVVTLFSAAVSWLVGVTILGRPADAAAAGALFWLPFVSSALACAAVAMSAAVGHVRIAAIICLLLVIVGAGIYAAGGFGGFVLLAAGYAAATALLIGMAAISVTAYVTRSTSRH